MKRKKKTLMYTTFYKENQIEGKQATNMALSI